MFIPFTTQGRGPRYDVLKVNAPSSKIGSVYDDWAILDTNVYRRDGNQWNLFQALPLMSSGVLLQAKIWNDVLVLLGRGTFGYALDVYEWNGAAWVLEHTENFVCSVALSDWTPNPRENDPLRISIADNTIVVGMDDWNVDSNLYSEGKISILTRSGTPASWSINAEFVGTTSLRLGMGVSVDPITFDISVVCLGAFTRVKTYRLIGGTYDEIDEVTHTEPYSDAYGFTTYNGWMVRQGYWYQWNGTTWVYVTSNNIYIRGIYAIWSDRSYVVRQVSSTPHDIIKQLTPSSGNRVVYTFTPTITYNDTTETLGCYGSHGVYQQLPSTDLNAYVVWTPDETRLYYRVDESLFV